MALNNHSEYGALLLRQPGNLRESDDEDDLITDTSSNGVRNVQDMLRVSRAGICVIRYSSKLNWVN